MQSAPDYEYDIRLLSKRLSNIELKLEAITNHLNIKLGYVPASAAKYVATNNCTTSSENTK